MRISRPLIGLATTLAILAACGPQPQPIDVVEATIGDIQEAISSGRTTCRMVVQAYIDRIEAYDKSTGLNAITSIPTPSTGQTRSMLRSTMERRWARCFVLPC